MTKLRISPRTKICHILDMGSSDMGKSAIPNMHVQRRIGNSIFPQIEVCGSDAWNTNHFLRKAMVSWRILF